MKILFRALALLLLSPLALADLYVRDGGSGAGTSWSDALDQVPSWNTNLRGQTIWVADGTYGGFNWQSTDTGAYVTVKKATVAEHGTETGWQAAYGDGVATWSSGITVRLNYVAFDGSVGGGVNSPRSGHGFKVNIGTDSKGIRNQLTGASRYTGLKVLHTEFLNAGAGGASQDGIFTNANDTHIAYNWIHDMGRIQIFLTGGNSSNPQSGHLIEQNTLERNRQTAKDGNGNNLHAEIMAIIWYVDDFVLRNNIVADYESTGGIIFWGSHNSIEACGNVITTDQYGLYEGGSVAGWIGGQSGHDADGKSGIFPDVKIYNNTMVDWHSRQGCASWGNGNTGGVVQRNNLFSDCDSYAHPVSGTPTPSTLGARGDNSHHYFHDVPSFTAVPNQQVGGDPFVDGANKNYRLSGPTDAGVALLGSACDVDAYGVTRGVDGVIDRGAYEFDAGGNVAPTAVIGSDVTSGTSPVTVNFNSTGSADSDGTIAAYEWDFKDGSALGSGATVQHVFTPNGVYDVSLRVQDDTGVWSQAVTRSITVTGGPVVPDTPVVTPAGKDSIMDVTASATCSTGGSVARYTTDGNDPTATSPVLTSAVISESTTIKVLCELSGLVSPIASQTYSFQPFTTATAHDSVPLGQAVTKLGLDVTVVGCSAGDFGVGLAQNESTGWNDQVMTARFYLGNIDYINGPGYSGTNACVDGVYGFLFDANLANKTYDLTMTAPSGATTLIADDAAFRDQAASAASLNYLTWSNDNVANATFTINNIDLNPGTAPAVDRSPLNVPPKLARPIGDYSVANNAPLDISLWTTFEGCKASAGFNPDYTLSGIPGIVKSVSSLKEIQKGRFTAPSYGADEVVTLTATCDNTLGPLVTETWNVTVAP